MMFGFWGGEGWGSVHEERVSLQVTQPETFEQIHVDTLAGRVEYLKKDVSSHFMVNVPRSFAFWLEVYQLFSLRQMEIFPIILVRLQSQSINCWQTSSANRSPPLVLSSWDKR